MESHTFIYSVANAEPSSSSRFPEHDIVGGRHTSTALLMKETSSLRPGNKRVRWFARRGQDMTREEPELNTTYVVTYLGYYRGGWSNKGFKQRGFCC